ncbi:hypothetical protein KJ765_05695 [Candidatus Micrarchaeota archaeon]|nr:hypothetical protein [Candidatus Micrarchaeota archaeon]
MSGSTRIGTGTGFLDWMIMLLVMFMVLTQLGLPGEGLLSFLRGSEMLGGLEVTALFVGMGYFLKQYWASIEGIVTFGFFAGVLLLLGILA